MVAQTSSAKSRRPRVASTGAVSVPPNPRRSTAIGRTCSGSSAIEGKKNGDDETLPWMNTTGRPSIRSTTSRTQTANRGVSIMLTAMFG